MNQRQNFTKSVKLAAWNRCRGRCEQCYVKLFPGYIEYHHAIEDTFGGKPVLENCLVLCRPCHQVITNKRAAVIAKSNRVRNKHLGIKKKSRGFKSWRRFDGSVVRRNDA